MTLKAFVDLCGPWVHHPGDDPAGARPAALDIGTGQGGDALWLASRGWDVTAIDISPTATRGIDDLARSHGWADRLRGVCRDLLVEELPPGTWRLITASYFHPGEHVDRAPVLRAAFAQLAPGGTLLVIDHASTSPWSWAEPGTTYPSAAHAFEALELPGARVLETSTRQRVGRGPDHRYATVEDNVIAVSRPEDPPREKGISASG